MELPVVIAMSVVIFFIGYFGGRVSEKAANEWILLESFESPEKECRLYVQRIGRGPYKLVVYRHHWGADGPAWTRSYQRVILDISVAWKAFRSLRRSEGFK